MSEKNKGLTFKHDRLLSLFRYRCVSISEFQDSKIMQVLMYIWKRTIAT